MLTLAPDLAESVQKQVWTVMCGLVHDLRQPLSVMEACADYLDLVIPDDKGLAHQQLELLQQQIVEANRFLHEALTQVSGREVRPKPMASAAAASGYVSSAGPHQAAAAR